MQVRSKLGYTWAALGIPIMLVFIMGMDFWMNLFFVKPGVTHSERISGGKIQMVTDYDGYRAQIHKPVFEGYFKDSENGFIQIDWIAEKSFPEHIVEDIDYNMDGKMDFRLKLNTVKNSAGLIPYNSLVKAVSDEKVMVLEKQRTVRINLVRGEK